ncbi:MAG: C25 family cysteine peptidase, partial [Candidatus Cloacimonadales bacterium]
FNSSAVNGLNNGPQMPFATWLTCSTGTFDSYSEAIIETMLRAGTPTIPKGGIGAVGVATSSTHTCFNNAMNYGIYDGIFRYDIQRMGDALLSGKLNLYLSYPDNPLDNVDIFSYWTNLMGDPGLELWTAFPSEITVEYDSEIALGTNYLEVFVTDENGTPVEDAWVTALQGDDEIFESAYSDSDGRVVLPIDAINEGEGTLTVTKPNHQAHLGTFTVSTETAFVNVISFEVDDSAANNDGSANPGETLDLLVTVQNFGTGSASNVNVDFSSENEQITVNSGSVDFGDIAAGATATAAVNLSVAASALGSQEIEIDLQFSESWSDKIYLPIAGVHLNFSEVSQEFDPGDSGNLSVSLDNLGVLDATDLSAELFSSHPFITVTDALGSYGMILAGDNSTNSSNPFAIQVNSSALPGTQYPMSIELSNAAGFQQTIHFVLEVGEVTITDPLGPDAGGYVCYDMGDVDYYMVPEYDWIEINEIGTELAVSDNGNMGDSEVISLPFAFQFYGEQYDEMTVCTNGWMAPGVEESLNYMNWPIPGAAGPAPLIAPFWDDLMSSGAGLYYHHDTSQNLFIVQWDNFICEDQPDETETFQVIIYDETYYPTTSGNNSIKFQYKDFANVTEGDYGSYHVEHGAYASIGIKDHTGKVGLGYSYYNQYPTAAAELSDESAILFTEAPVPLEQAYLVIDELAILTETATFDQGKEIELDILLSNLGENTAYEVEAELTTEDPYVDILSASASYNNIANSYPAVNLSPYQLQAATDVPDNYHASFVLEITTSEQNFSLDFSIPIRKPQVQYKSVAIWDEDNGMLDPGETAELFVTFENVGVASLQDAVFELSETDANLTINEATFNAGTIPGSSNVTGVFNVTVSPSAEVGSAIPITAEISGADGYSNSSEFNVNIGLMVEDFESGGFESFDWQFSGNADWVISSDAYEGDYAAKSGDINDNQATGMQISMNIPADGEISFQYNVSSENNYDYLRFYIDGSEQDSWSGLQAWSNATFPVSAGEHTFKWEYTKDGSVDSNSDCAWVDNIVFPGGSSIADIAFIQGSVDIQGEADYENVTLRFGSFITHPNPAGDYYLPVAPGTHDLEASLPEFLTQIEADLALTAGEIYNRDFTLVEVASLAVPTELTAEMSDDDIILNWNAPATREVVVGTNKKTGAKETVTRDLLGYNIYRDGHLAAEVSSSITTYSEIDIPGGIYEYFVTALYSEGESLPSNTATTEQTSADDIIPLSTELQGNYPNPFNPTTNISFSLHQASKVSLEIYNIKGQKVKNLVEREFAAGRHSVVWNGKDNNGRSVASGVYFYRMRAESFSALQKMMLIK